MPPTRIRVLLVDDDATLRRSLARVLRRTMHVDLAADAQSAIGLLEKGSYHVVVSDHSMPGRTGHELLLEIAQRWPETHRILMSADADAQSGEPRSWERFFEKPLSPSELAEAIRLLASLA